MGQLMRVLSAPEVSAASGGCSEPERAGQRRRAMRAHNHVRSQRDMPQPDESLEVDQKKRASFDARFSFVALPPTGRLHRSRRWRSGSAHRAFPAKRVSPDRAVPLILICPFIDDIYQVTEQLAIQDDIRVLRVKDYIQNPKPNGYRSYHMILEVPVFFMDNKELMQVEVQFRTVAMDFWASLEHQIK